jgi:hypothetical protein
MRKTILGSIGVLTIDDDAQLYVVDSVLNGLVYCHPLTGPKRIRVVLIDHFWSLIDSL